MSVLGPSWRTLWKSLSSLRIDMGADINETAKFVNSLLLYRDQTPLHECEILSDPRDREGPWGTDEINHAYETLLRTALSCKVRVLRIKILGGYYLQLSSGTLISEHLTRLILYGVEFEDFALGVSSCQSLEELELDHCEICIDGYHGTDFPKSLRLLRIRNSSFLPEDYRSFISAPGLVTLELADCSEYTPWLKSLPSLVTAFITIEYEAFCQCCGAMPSVGCCDLDDGVLLKGLSGATNLELISHRSMVCLLFFSVDMLAILLTPSFVCCYSPLHQCIRHSNHSTDAHYIFATNSLFFIFIFLFFS
jgi:hypothetical protein